MALIVKVNFDPIPYSDSTEILPSNFYVSFLQIVKPSPTPLLLIPDLCESIPKSWKSFYMSSCLIPIPVSSTENSRMCLLLS